jgi:hypothetical protein
MRPGGKPGPSSLDAGHHRWTSSIPTCGMIATRSTALQATRLMITPIARRHRDPDTLEAAR